MGTLSTGLSASSKIPGFMPNLFEVSVFGENPDPTTGDTSFSEIWGYTGVSVQPVKFYCSGYELPSPALTAERNKYTKKAYVKKYAIPETVSITWQENSHLDVWKYHQEWLRRFYNRETDQFVTQPTGKKRNAHITIQQYPGYGLSYFDPFKDEDLMEVYTIKLIGLIPQSIPPLRGDWNQDASNSANLVIKYFVDYIAIAQSNAFVGAQ